MMNIILFIVVVTLFGVEAWNMRDKFLAVYVPWFKVKTPESERAFKTFRYIETNRGSRCIEEQKYRVI